MSREDDQEIRELDEMIGNAASMEPLDARRSFLELVVRALREPVVAAAGELERTGRLTTGELLLLTEHLFATVTLVGLPSKHDAFSADTKDIRIRVIPRHRIASIELETVGWHERSPYTIAEGLPSEAEVTLVLMAPDERIEVGGRPAALDRFYETVLRGLIA